MSQGKGLTGLAAIAAAAYTALTCGGLTQAVRAADSAVTPSSELTLAQPVSQSKYMDTSEPSTPAAGPVTPAPVAPPAAWTAQNLLAGTSVGDFLDKYKLTINGFVEGSYTYNFRKTPGRSNALRVFDIEREHLTLNQADLQIARAVDFSSTNWDVGGLIEMQYGEDARFLHSNGLNFYGHDNPQFSPRQQFDLTQAYVIVNAPIGNGLKIEAGKFVALQGYEVINPTGNALYSHSYMFGYAIPFTNTGILATYKFSDALTITAGITRGWDQALKDSNSQMIDFDGSFVYTPAAIKNFTLTFNWITGPEEAHNTRDYRTVGDLIAAYTFGDNWTFAFNGDWGFEPNAGVGGKDAQWFGGAIYATYKIDSHVSVTGRGEYFSDHDNARGFGGEAYEATLGAEITPLPDNKYLAGLLFRPEVRWDYSKQNLFDGGKKDNQATVAADLIYKF